MANDLVVVSSPPLAEADAVSAARARLRAARSRVRASVGRLGARLGSEVAGVDWRASVRRRPEVYVGLALVVGIFFGSRR